MGVEEQSALVVLSARQAEVLTVSQLRLCPDCQQGKWLSGKSSGEDTAVTPATPSKQNGETESESFANRSLVDCCCYKVVKLAQGVECLPSIQEVLLSIQGSTQVRHGHTGL